MHYNLEYNIISFKPFKNKYKIYWKGKLNKNLIFFFNLLFYIYIISNNLIKIFKIIVKNSNFSDFFFFLKKLNILI